MNWILKKHQCIVIFLLLFTGLHVFSQDAEPPKTKTRILFVLDVSQSMYGRWQSDVKINIARKLLTNLLDSLENVENMELGLRVYGHMHQFPPQVCNDSKLIVPFGENSIDEIKRKLPTLVPRGTTPIAYALEQAGYDFPECDHCRNIIILITDGLEECDGDPCAVSRALQKRGIALKPFVIGIGMNFEEAFDCVGTYFDASSEKEFNEALNVVISQALDATTAQVNLLDESGIPSETNVPITFYDHFSGLLKYTFVHTLNHKGLPDTLVLDPLLDYDIKVHTIPPVFKDSVSLVAGKHTIIPINAPQGSLHLKLPAKDKFMKDLNCIVRQSGEMNTLNVQSFETEVKYITGHYDLEILTLPRIYVQDVEIAQSSTTTIEVPMAGIAVIMKPSAGFGGLLYEQENNTELIYQFNESASPESIVLQPGIYKAVFRARNASRSYSTIEKVFTVESGKTVRVSIY